MTVCGSHRLAHRVSLSTATVRYDGPPSGGVESLDGIRFSAAPALLATAAVLVTGVL
jgi:hypothetical protein